MLRVPALPTFAYSKETYADYVTSLATIGCTVTDEGANTAGTRIHSLDYGVAGKPVIFITGGIHGGHEWRSPYIIKRFFEYLVAPGASPHKAMFLALRRHFRFFSFPLLNPYGYTAPSYCNDNAVNVLVNFDGPDWAGWTETSCTSKGAAPWDQPEAELCRVKVVALDPVAFFDCHVWGAGTGLYVYRMTRELDQISKNYVRATERTLNIVSTINVLKPDEGPYAGGWAALLDGGRGKKVISNTQEPGSTNTDEEIMTMGLNGLFQFCVHVYQYFRFGCQNPQQALT